MIKRANRIILGIILLLALANAAVARTALVIGNSAYRNDPLINPANDAADIAAALRELGFSVLHKQNLDKRGMIGCAE